MPKASAFGYRFQRVEQVGQELHLGGMLLGCVLVVPVVYHPSVLAHEVAFLDGPCGYSIGACDVFAVFDELEQVPQQGGRVCPSDAEFGRLSAEQGLERVGLGG